MSGGIPAPGRRIRRRVSIRAGIFGPIAVVVLAVGSAAAERHFDRWETISRSEGLPSNKVFAVAVDGSRVWAGTEEGLALIDKRTGRVERIFDATNGLPFSAVTALARG